MEEFHYVGLFIVLMIIYMLILKIHRLWIIYFVMIVKWKHTMGEPLFTPKNDV
jgi:hypothetical protein